MTQNERLDSCLRIITLLEVENIEDENPRGMRHHLVSAELRLIRCDDAYIAQIYACRHKRRTGKKVDEFPVFTTKGATIEAAIEILLSDAEREFKHAGIKEADLAKRVHAKCPPLAKCRTDIEKEGMN